LKSSITRILIVEDDRALLAGIQRMLSDRTETELLEADSCVQALKAIEEASVDVVLLDVHLADGHAREVLSGMGRRTSPAVIVMTADDDSFAELSLHRSVDSYLLKPFSAEALEAAIDQAIAVSAVAQTSLRPASLRPASIRPPTMVPPPEAPTPQQWRAMHAPEMLGDDPRLMRVFRMIQSVCDTDCSVLITGDSGTGKELVARAIHAASGRAHAPFVTVNCAALPENLVESELFGHVRGAFTGAIAPRIGRFVAAEGGTLFLDEVGELPLSQQAKLLRAVQEKEVVPVGETRARKTDVRLLAATHRDLESMVDQGTFREDLFYRIQVVPIEVPALRDRRRDIPQLIDSFVRRANQRRKRSVKGVSKEAMAMLEAYDWPGNVRQLENLVERMVLLRSHGEIGLEDLPSRIIESCNPAQAQSGPVLPEDGIDLRDAVEQFENALILQALERSGWNKNRAATMLRMNRTTLVERLKKKNFIDAAHVA
jgi:DNA-binding NtrC family response regulator